MVTLSKEAEETMADLSQKATTKGKELITTGGKPDEERKVTESRLDFLAKMYATRRREQEETDEKEKNQET